MPPVLLGTKPVVCWGGSQKDSPLPGVSAGAFLADSPEGARWVPPLGASVSPRGMWHGEAGPQGSRWERRGEICFVQSPTSVRGPDEGAELLTATPWGAWPCPSSVPAGHQGSFGHVPPPSRLHKAQEGTPPPPPPCAWARVRGPEHQFCPVLHPSPHGEGPGETREQRM